MDPFQLAVGFVALLALVSGVASLVVSLRSSPTRLRNDFDALMESCDGYRARVQAVESDGNALRTEWVKAQSAIVELLEELRDQYARIERKRSSARTERQRAEKAQDDNGVEPASFVCQLCGYEHMRGEDCMGCAKRRFSM